MQCIAQHFEFDEFIDGQRNAILYTRADIEHRHTDGLEGGSVICKSLYCANQSILHVSSELTA